MQYACCKNPYGGLESDMQAQEESLTCDHKPNLLISPTVRSRVSCRHAALWCYAGILHTVLRVAHTELTPLNHRDLRVPGAALRTKPASGSIKTTREGCTALGSGHAALTPGSTA